MVLAITAFIFCRIAAESHAVPAIGEEDVVCRVGANPLHTSGFSLQNWSQTSWLAEQNAAHSSLLRQWLGPSIAVMMPPAGTVPGVLPVFPVFVHPAVSMMIMSRITGNTGFNRQSEFIYVGVKSGTSKTFLFGFPAGTRATIWWIISE